MPEQVQESFVISEVLQLAGIKNWQLDDWKARELVPGWTRFQAYGGGGLRYWYPPETVECCRKIKAWRDEGISYRQIRTLLRAEGFQI